jgi:hypothetical protein
MGDGLELATGLGLALTLGPPLELTLWLVLAPWCSLPADVTLEMAETGQCYLFMCLAM